MYKKIDIAPKSALLGLIMYKILLFIALAFTSTTLLAATFEVEM